MGAFGHPSSACSRVGIRGRRLLLFFVSSATCLVGTVRVLRGTSPLCTVPKSNIATPETEMFPDPCLALTNANVVALADSAPVRMGKAVAANVAGMSFDMFVYGANGGIDDIVSRTIDKGGAWETEATEKMMKLLGLAGGRGVLLDVGANVGWFSLVTARLGHDVISFEPFERNLELLCASRAMLPESGRERHRVVGLGLDYRERRCELFQMTDVNFGDTFPTCDERTRHHMSSKGYKSLGRMNTTTLDDALLGGAFRGLDRVDVMKIDVEGFEHNVIAGGNRFFESRYAPRYIFIELVSKYMGWAVGDADALGRGADRLRTVLLRLSDHGYDLHDFWGGGTGASVSMEGKSFEDIRRAVDGKTVWFIKKE